MRRFAQATPIMLLLVAAALLMGSLRLPLWHIRLEAPQYRGPEALRIAVHPNAMRGDLKELSTLNQYIGVHIPPTLPQFKWLPAAILSAALLGLSTCGLGGSIRAIARFVIPAALAVALGFAAVQANLQMRDIGHHRDHKTPLVGVQDFTPPFLGKTKIAQFEVTSAFGLGAWLIGVALALQAAAGYLSLCAERDFERGRFSRNTNDSRARLSSACPENRPGASTRRDEDSRTLPVLH